MLCDVVLVHATSGSLHIRPEDPAPHTEPHGANLSNPAVHHAAPAVHHPHQPFPSPAKPTSSLRISLRHPSAIPISAFGPQLARIQGRRCLNASLPGVGVRSRWPICAAHWKRAAPSTRHGWRVTSMFACSACSTRGLPSGISNGDWADPRSRCSLKSPYMTLSDRLTPLSRLGRP